MLTEIPWRLRHLSLRLLKAMSQVAGVEPPFIGWGSQSSEMSGNFANITQHEKQQ